MRVLIVDASPELHVTLTAKLEAWGHVVQVSAPAADVAGHLKHHECDVVLVRWQSVDAADLEVVRRIRDEVHWQYVYVLVIASHSGTDTIVQALEAGADEVLLKPFSSRELRARLSSAERVANLGRALAENNRQMRADLEAGAKFARSLLPKPLSTPWQVNYRHIPAAAVSGDAFGYHWIDADHFAVYVLDASGHGLDAALLAVSIMNVLRSQTLPETNFRRPAEVLRGLNRAFPMEDYGDKCFTIWYGVIARKSLKLTWTGGGHPPAVLVSARGDVQLLRSTGPVMGAVDFDYAVQSTSIAPRSRLYLYSDGVSEIRLAPGQHRSTEEFVAVLKGLQGENVLDRVIEDVRTLRHGLPPEDDVTIIEVRF